MQKLLIMSGCNESAFYLQNGEVSELEHHAQDLPVHSILEEESATTASTEMSNGREEDVPHAEPNDNSDDDPTYSAHVSDSSDSSSTSSDRLEGFRRPKKFKKSVKTSSLPRKRDVLHAELSDSDDDPTYYAHESDSSDSSSTSSDRLEGFRRPKKFKKSVKTSSLPRKRAIPSDSRAPVKMKAEQDDTISSSSITVLCANNREKRKWDKRQVCVYCEKFVSKLPRHLESHHQNEAPVQEFLSHPKKTTPRAQLLKILQNEGNHKHNISVLEVQSGSLIPVKRPSGYVDYRDYLPCDECLGWFVSSDMWKHKKTCFVAQKSGRKHGKTLQSRCALMLPMSKSATADLRETVLSRMRYPCPISMAARNDDLICKMGSRVLKQTKASSSTCYQTVSQKMREMARLLRRLREDNSVLTMKDCIDPKMFDNVIDAVRQEAGFNAKTGKYATPSLALKLGHSLSMCATICRAEAIKQEDRITKLKAEDFEDLCKSEWRVEVSKGALQGLEEKRWNAPPAIPMTSEVTKVRQCVFKAIEENKAILQEAQYPSGNTYASLAQAILADIVMFNRRRSGEVQRLKLDDISKAKFGDNNPEIMCCLSQWEQQLCKELTRLEIRGKRGRKVPVLLTKEMSANIKFLSEKRAFAGVKDSNPYLFGIPGCDTSYRGSDCIRKFAQASGVEHPEYITSTKLRKHVATMSQLISLKENELDVLATFMGHDIRTHRHYYRLPEDTLQTAKVAKLLILADRERLTSCAGKSLDAIDLEEPCYETDDQGIDDCDDIQDDGDCGETCQPTDRESTDRESPDRESTDRESTSQLQPMKKVMNLFSIGTHKMEKLTWLEEEGKAVDNFFASHVSNCQVPRKHECLECKGQYPILERIEWQKIKFRVHNKINQMKKSRSLLVQHKK
ncbi:uncharacterized protein LOC105446919 isoform X3 [Strongylocentrotus purpuratus]|uniref:Uncharacterized protein n=1 Tax=Strongylocentrotus purpuratus TaxID=7668 RepID=A0A7M7PTI1_STRPU|nr:uncharacterized protein LOC105446919 isoform X3 [Strongylocentrotus purpuratus]